MIGSPTTERTICPVLRTSSKLQVPCSQSTKTESAPSSIKRLPVRRTRDGVVYMVMASPAKSRERRFAPFKISSRSISLACPAYRLARRHHRATSISADVSRMNVGQMWSSGMTALLFRLAQRAIARATSCGSIMTARSESKGGLARLSMMGVFVSPGRIVVALIPWFDTCCERRS